MNIPGSLGRNQFTHQRANRRGEARRGVGEVGMGETCHNFLPFIEQLLWDPFLCEWGKYRTKPRPSGAYAIGFISSQSLHITHLPQEVLFGYLALSQKCLRFHMDALERPVRTGGASEGLGGEWEPSWRSAYHAALANCIPTLPTAPTAPPPLRVPCGASQDVPWGRGLCSGGRGNGAKAQLGVLHRVLVSC